MSQPSARLRSRAVVRLEEAYGAEVEGWAGRESVDGPGVGLRGAMFSEVFYSILTISCTNFLKGSMYAGLERAAARSSPWGFVHSESLTIPYEDPTLLFTSTGMNHQVRRCGPAPPSSLAPRAR